MGLNPAGGNFSKFDSDICVQHHLIAQCANFHNFLTTFNFWDQIGPKSCRWQFFKLLFTNFNSLQLVTAGYLVVTLIFLLVTAGYCWLLLVTGGYWWLLLVPSFRKNGFFRFCRRKAFVVKSRFLVKFGLHFESQIIFPSERFAFLNIAVKTIERLFSHYTLYILYTFLD